MGNLDIQDKELEPGNNEGDWEYQLQNLDLFEEISNWGFYNCLLTPNKNNYCAEVCWICKNGLFNLQSVCEAYDHCGIIMLTNTTC